MFKEDLIDNMKSEQKDLCKKFLTQKNHYKNIIENSENLLNKINEKLGVSTKENIEKSELDQHDIHCPDIVEDDGDKYKDKESEENKGKESESNKGKESEENDEFITEDNKK